MKKNTVKIIVLMWVGYAIFCCFGILPKSLSLIKFPSSLQRYDSLYNYVGYTYRDKFDVESNKPFVKKGTFDSLGLFDNGNIANDGFYDSNRNVFYLNLNDNVVKFKGTKRLKKITSHKQAGNGIVLKAGKYYYSFDDERARVIMSKDNVFLLQTNIFEVDGDNDLLDYNAVIELLKRQTEESITMHEFGSLLLLVSQEKLVYWNADDSYVVFKQAVSNSEYLIRRFEVESFKEEVFGPFKEHEFQFFFSSDSVLYYDEDNNSIDINFYTNDSVFQTLVQVDNVDMMNFKIVDDKKLLYCFADENFVYWRYPHKDLDIEFGNTNTDMTDGETFLIGKNHAVIYKDDDHHKLSYSYMELPDYKITDN